MQDPNEDTVWNDVLRAKGIIPPKEDVEITEDDIINMVESTIGQKIEGKALDDMTKDELDELEDEIDEEEERIFEQIRRQRIAEMQKNIMAARYGDVIEISKSDWVSEVNQAGEGVWVIIHVYKQGIPLCTLLNNHLAQLAQKFRETKFLKSISSVCIPNYPDKNLPTIFVYCEGDLKKQWVGPVSFGGMNIKVEDLEWMLKCAGAIKSEMQENPRTEVHDVLKSSLINGELSDDDDDW